ncbi:MAG: O-methyltransferase [Planctomycetota bacterium]|nr:MAG: O-methyltransferase [Planctomycetota bacterium]
MSDAPTLVSSAHFDYIAERTAGDDAFLADLKQAARDAGIPPIWVNAAQLSFMQVLLKLVGAREVLEVGTLAGSTAIGLARALPEGGRVRTVELEPKHASFAEDWVARSDVAERVQVIRGAGQDVLPALPDGELDALFLDADKAGYVDYVEQGRRLLRPGGLLMVDNAFAFGQLFDDTPTDREAGAVRAFNDRMASQAHGDDAPFQAIIVPLGDGMWVGVRR